VTVTWAGEVTWAEVRTLREEIATTMACRTASVIRLDVGLVTRIGHGGAALIMAAGKRVRSTGRLLLLVDTGGVVSDELHRLELMADLLRAHPGLSPGDHTSHVLPAPSLRQDPVRP
jgi:anti-anti-sigma regulatory factor